MSLGRSWYVTAYRLLRRMLVLQLTRERHIEPDANTAEYVEIFIQHPSADGAGRRLGDLVRGIGQGLGLEVRSLELYSDEEMRQISIRLADTIDGLGPDGNASEQDKELARVRAENWPNWPLGWQEAIERARIAKAADERKKETT